MIVPLLKGLAKTFEQCFRKPITVRYPEEKREIPERFRGHPRLLRDEQGRTKCVACMLCATVCPSLAITIEPAEGAEMHIKYPKKYEIDLTRCIYCGFCEEACPVNAIELTRNYELSQYEKDKLIYDRDRLLKED
jgi:NADH-quinone oxidoreductase subunit I